MQKISAKTSSGKSNEYKIVDSFKLGYRNREDITNTAPGVLIVGSQNVSTNVSERIQIRKGYSVDGDPSSVGSAILAAFDWETLNSESRNLRAGFLTSAGNDGKLQYRYVDNNGTVTWRDLMINLTSVAFNFCTFWNETDVLREMLFVNGASEINAWSGGVTTFASATSNTVTKQGSSTWAQEGFYTAGTRTIVINGVTATYTAGEGTTTLTGVSVDFSATAAGAVIHQGVRTIANSAMTGIDSGFKNALIANLNNQIYVGALNSAKYFISKISDYTDYSFSSPRQVGEGWHAILDGNLVAFIPQENYMYVSAGKDYWYNISFQIQTSTVGITYEQVGALPLKTGVQQGARSQAFVSHMKNNVIVVTREPTVDTFGRIETSLATPQTTNISDPIKLDMDKYDFTDGSIFYFQYYIYVAVPKEGLVLGFNLNTNSWDAPATVPVSRFYIVDGELYGHSYATSESYKLNEGYADRVYPGFVGFPIEAKAVFSYQNYGTRTVMKRANGFYIEGYINANTVLNCELTYELDGCATTKTFEINGSDRQIVCIPTDDGSLGKESLGKHKIGGGSFSSMNGLPPKFRVEKTFNNTNFFECSFSFDILGIDNRFELLAFGLNAALASEEPVKIRQ